ncbi:MAG: hypothetical protein ABIH34_06055 [Nanoarchaeota archaeon]
MKITKTEDVKGEAVEKLKKLYFEQIETNTPEEIKDTPIFDLDHPGELNLVLTKELVEKWNLRAWLENYRKEAEVSTGGIRGPQNVKYPWDVRYPLNELGVALATMGKALVLKEDIKEREINKICSGEVRYNTERYIDLISRIQAAQGIKTHLPKGREKTSIWMTSFLIFLYDYDGGEYVTSSHAMSSKTATKDLDNQGSQFIPEMSVRFVDKIEWILDVAEKDGFYIPLSARDHPLIVDDVVGFKEYLDYLKKGVATPHNIDLIKKATDRGMEILFECVGGCMYPMMKKLFSDLGIVDTFSWNNVEEDPFFHGVGKIMENPVTKKKEFFDWGCDTTIKQVTETLGYEKLLSDKDLGFVVMMTDPDGDRIVVGQVEEASRKSTLETLGIPYIELDNDRIFPFFTPNQLFFLVMVFHQRQLKESGLWDEENWFMITTTPSAASWVEWAEEINLPYLYVPVGFKEIANLMKKVERHAQDEAVLNDIFGRKVALGAHPKLLFAGEESGGMITGPVEYVKSRGGRTAIAMREKSAGEASIIITALAAELFLGKKFLSDYLAEIYETHKIKRIFDVRRETRFYNESNPDPVAMLQEKKAGEVKRDKNDQFFMAIALAVKDRIITIEHARGVLSEAFPDLYFGNLRAIHFVGDGTYLDFDDKYVEVRKSGTDAIIKAYCAAEKKDEYILYADALAQYDGAQTPLFNKLIPSDFVLACQEKGRALLREFQKG